MLGLLDGTELSVPLVTRAFRRMSLHLHPDKSDAPGAEVAFKRLGTAYEAIKEKLENGATETEEVRTSQQGDGGGPSGCATS